MVTHRLFDGPNMLIPSKNSRVDILASAILTTYEILFFVCVGRPYVLAHWSHRLIA
jgi:hypothetical protein